MHHQAMTRRTLAGMACALAVTRRSSRAQEVVNTWPDWSIVPIGWPGAVPGDGFRIGHGFASENAWFAAGWWHTGEDWYAIEGDTAGADVYAVARGEVVYADFSYPGRVVIVRHDDDLYTMYGHLNPESVPPVGMVVEAGGRIGTVLQQASARGPGQAPSHLHFEVRTFFMRDDVNGDAPQHGVNCGFQCPPGPGYWPISAPTHPVDHGWLNPTAAALERLDPAALADLLLVANSASDSELVLRTDPDANAGALGPMTVEEIVVLDEVVAGDPVTTETSADAYDAWLQVSTTDGTTGWLQVAVPSLFETGSDGRPSAVERPILFAIPQ